MKHFIHFALGTGALIGMLYQQPVSAMTISGIAGNGGQQDATAAPAMQFTERGNIDSINVKEGQIVLNGRSYKLAHGARVYGPGGLMSQRALRTGMTVEFNTTVHGTTYFVSEIRIAPAK
ncbi:MAG: hypothetical protein ACYC9K_02690 [Sulfuricaulis sp.]